MKNNRFSSIYAGMLCLTLAAFFLGCTSAKKEGQEDAGVDTVCVSTVSPELKMFSPTVNCTGILTTTDETLLSFKTPGIIKGIFCSEGQFIHKGQKLAELDLTEISAIRLQAKTAYEKASRDLERAKHLYTDSVATHEQLQNAQSAYEAAGASLNQVNFNVEHSVIYAQANSYVLKKLANEGEIRSAGMPVLCVGNIEKNEWLVKAGVSDKDIVRLSENDTAQITIDAYPGLQFTGKVRAIAKFPDQATGTYTIEIVFNGKATQLAYGFTAKVHIAPKAKTEALFIPLTAVLNESSLSASVWIVNGNSPNKFDFTIEYFIGNYVIPRNPPAELLQPSCKLIAGGKTRVQKTSYIVLNSNGLTAQ